MIDPAACRDIAGNTALQVRNMLFTLTRMTRAKGRRATSEHVLHVGGYGHIAAM